jgi:hypothetical protein
MLRPPFHSIKYSTGSAGSQTPQSVRFNGALVADFRRCGELIDSAAPGENPGIRGFGTPPYKANGGFRIG